jgi:hypothetical protein
MAKGRRGRGAGRTLKSFSSIPPAQRKARAAEKPQATNKPPGKGKPGG